MANLASGVNPRCGKREDALLKKKKKKIYVLENYGKIYITFTLVYLFFFFFFFGWGQGLNLSCSFNLHHSRGNARS